MYWFGACVGVSHHLLVSFLEYFLMPNTIYARLLGWLVGRLVAWSLGYLYTLNVTWTSGLHCIYYI